jgi:hypothetical protein
MKINNLGRVKVLTESLTVAVANHNAMMALTESGAGSWGLDSNAYISLGGDHYGNGIMHKFEIKIKNSPEMVKVCRGLQSDAWGKVVSIRASLRSLGVNMDNQGDSK